MIEVCVRTKAGRVATDDCQSHRKAKAGGTDDRLRAAADTDAHLHGARLGLWVNLLVLEWLAGGSVPADRSLLEEFD